LSKHYTEGEIFNIYLTRDTEMDIYFLRVGEEREGRGEERRERDIYTLRVRKK
jgi:hypothetical protein